MSCVWWWKYILFSGSDVITGRYLLRYSIGVIQFRRNSRRQRCYLLPSVSFIHDSVDALFNAHATAISRAFPFLCFIYLRTNRNRLLSRSNYFNRRGQGSISQDETFKARCNGDSLRSASARGNWSYPVATAALSTYSLTRLARPRVQNRATVLSCCRSLTRWSTCQLDLPARKLSPLQRAFMLKCRFDFSSGNDSEISRYKMPTAWPVLNLINS